MRIRLTGVLVLLALLHGLVAAEVVTVKSLVGDTPRVGEKWLTDLRVAMAKANPSAVRLRPTMPNLISGHQMVGALDRLQDSWQRVALQRKQLLDRLPASAIHELRDVNALAHKLTFPTPQAKGRFTFGLTTLAGGRPTLATVDLERWLNEHPWSTRKPISFINTSLVNTHLDTLKIDRRALAQRPIVPVVAIDPTQRIHMAHDIGRLVENLPVNPSSKRMTKLIVEGKEWQQIASNLEMPTGDAVRKQFVRNALPRIERAAGTTLAELRLARPPGKPRASLSQLLVELLLMIAPLSGTTVLVISVLLLAGRRS